MPATNPRPVPPVVNRLWSFLIRRGFAPKSMYLLTVCGRKTGKPYTTVVALVEQAGEQFLVAPYGETKWVQNARAVKQVSLRHGKQ
jgi:deazaflavin-dependent oxidoreductase (nitroreductase family)